MRFHEGGKNTMPLGMFPEHIVPKTDELRIQSYPNLLQELWGLPYVIRMKYDGTSFTCFSFREESGICSRNLQLKETDNDVYWKIAHKYDLPKKLNEYCKLTDLDLAIQGEIIGPIVIHGGKNPLNTTVDDLYLFSVYNIRERCYMDDVVAESIAACLGIKFVSLIEKGDFFKYTLEELEFKVKGLLYYSTNNLAEGFVVRPQHYTYSPMIGRQLSFKVINPEYSLLEK